MVDAYDFARSRVAATLGRMNTGTITLTRTTPGTPNPLEPWVPAEPIFDVYSLQGRVDGVAAEYVDGAVILASDLVAIVSPKAVHTMSDGEEAGGAIVDIVPRMTDTLQVDGATKVIKKIAAVPAGGEAAMFKVFIAS